MKINILKALVLGASLAAFPAFAVEPDGLITSKAKLFLSSVTNERIDKPFSLAQIKQLVDRHLDAPP